MAMGLLAMALVIIAASAGAFEINVFPTESPVRYNDPKFMYHQQDIFGYSISDFIGNPNTNLAFVNFSSDPASFTLAIVLNADPGIQYPVDAKTPGKTSRLVWEANRGRPVRVNASLSLSKDGDLVLRDVDGKLAWSAGTRGATRVALDMDAAVLTVYGSNGEALWRSSDHPTDTLVLGQDLKPGMRLQSRRNLTTNEEGVFSLVMEPGGLVLYSNISGSLQPYWVRSHFEGRDDLDAARHTCKSLTMASLQVVIGGLSLIMNESRSDAGPTLRSQALCSLENKARLVVQPYTIEARNGSFIRLDWDGHLRGYAMVAAGAEVAWNILDVFPASGQSCLVPGKCGNSGGICSQDQCVGCLSPDSPGTAGWSSACLSPRYDSCANTELVPLNDSGIEYFSSAYLVKPSNMSLEDCKLQCVNNCSCSAVFYWQETKSCFVHDDVTSLLKTGNASHLAYVRINKSRAGRKHKALVAGLASATVVGAIVVLGIGFLLLRRKFKALPDYDTDTFLESLESLRPMRFTQTDLSRITSDFSKLLGAGGFGGVYEGVLPDGRKVAVKKLERTGQGKKEFYAEVSVLGTLHHANLVKLLGFCSEGNSRMLVYEHLANGSLDRWIFQERDFLDWRTRMEVLLGTARGLCYLHEECTERIIHLDIKPQNILLDEAFAPKVADFGLSRLMNREESFVVTTLRGTPGYLAPEWLLDAAITEKSDIYSFGIVVLEVVSGRKNFTRAVGQSDVLLATLGLELVRQSRHMELVDPRLLDAAEETEVLKMIGVAYQCLQGDPASRPSMSRVVQMLEGLCAVPQVPSGGFTFGGAMSSSSTSASNFGVSCSSSSTSAVSNNAALSTESTTVSLLSAR